MYIVLCHIVDDGKVIKQLVKSDDSGIFVFDNMTKVKYESAREKYVGHKC